MKKLILPALAASALLLGACSTTQLAQQSNAEDDVYFTKAKAREVQNPVVNTDNTQNTQNTQDTRNERTYRTDEQLYGGGNYTDEYYNDYNYDYGYASRLNRFYDRSPWRSGYYDSWYSYSYMPWYTYRYDPFFYDPWYYSPGTSVWIGVGVYPRYGWYDNYYWGLYGSPYNSRYWGPYSYYNVYPGYAYGGGGYYGGGYYGGVNQLPNRRRPTYTDPNYRSRPGSGGYSNPPRTVGVDGQGRVMTGNSRGERWGNTNTNARPAPETSGRNSGRTSNTPPARTERAPSSNEGTGSSRAARPERVEQSRPSRETYSPPASSTPSRSSGGSNSGGGGGSSRSSRPSRAGGN